ncbi:MAG TPA: FKBP-type peptidylprolyl isomerase [Planctomycetaceae bacterium]|nr:FKBP-type peptidylprolyl isomerase [Planctomycetaceae bacterium]
MKLKSIQPQFALLIMASCLLWTACATQDFAPGTSAQPSSTVGPADSLEKATPGPVEAANAEFAQTASGLRYRILRSGQGAKPTASSLVVSHYKGWLDDGSIFDSSYRSGQPIKFPLGGVIPGWTEGLQLIGEGGMIELEIPSQLGYGEQGMPPVIPPKSRLHFIVELVKVL